VLVLAWYHGDKGDQRASRPELAILVTIVAIVGAAMAESSTLHEVTVS
jgi:hypothetical protein